MVRTRKTERATYLGEAVSDEGVCTVAGKHAHPTSPSFDITGIPRAFWIPKDSISSTDTLSPPFTLVHPPRNPHVRVLLTPSFCISHSCACRTLAQPADPTSVENTDEWDDGRQLV